MTTKTHTAIEYVVLQGLVDRGLMEELPPGPDGEPRYQLTELAKRLDENEVAALLAQFGKMSDEKH